MHKLIRLDKSTITPDNTHALDIWDFFFFFFVRAGVASHEFSTWHLSSSASDFVCLQKLFHHIRQMYIQMTNSRQAHTPFGIQLSCVIWPPSAETETCNQLYISMSFRDFFFYYKMKCNITLQENYNKTITSALVNWINDIEKKNDLCESRDTKWNLK